MPPPSDCLSAHLTPFSEILNHTQRTFVWLLRILF
jgi:hypothetical protein